MSSPDEDNMDDVWKQFMVATPPFATADLSSPGPHVGVPGTPGEAGTEVKMARVPEQPGATLVGSPLLKELAAAFRDTQNWHGDSLGGKIGPATSSGTFKLDDLPTFEDTVGDSVSGDGAPAADHFESAVAGDGGDAWKQTQIVPLTDGGSNEFGFDANIGTKIPPGNETAVLVTEKPHGVAACGVTVTSTVTDSVSTGMEVSTGDGSINDNFADIAMFDADDDYQASVGNILSSQFDTGRSTHHDNSYGGIANSAMNFANTGLDEMPHDQACVPGFSCEPIANNDTDVATGLMLSPAAQQDGQNHDNPSLSSANVHSNTSAPSNCTSEAISESIAHACNLTPTVTRHPAWPPSSPAGSPHTQRPPLIQGLGPPVPGILAGPRSIVDMTSDLHMSVMTSDISRIQRLVREGASRHKELYTGHDALYWAEYKSEDAVTRALFCNLDVASHGISHLMHAVRRNRTHIVTTLLALGVKQVLQAYDAVHAVFTVATFISTPEMLRTLLVHGPAVRVYKFEDLLVSCAMLANREENARLIRHFARLQRDKLASVTTDEAQPQVQMFSSEHT